MLPTVDLGNCDGALVKISYAAPVPAPRAGVLVALTRSLAFGDYFEDLWGR